MWKLRIGVLLASGALALGGSSAAWATSGGGANAGDVWVDNVGQPAGPGHEMDPHLACQDIDLWESGLGDSSSTFTIDGWPASGGQELDYSGTWSYNQSSGGRSGNQVIAVISVSKLISQAQANGDSAAAQGFHFKLDFSQDPQKHKTFWIDCSPVPSGDGGSGTGATGGGTTDGGGTTTTHSTAPDGGGITTASVTTTSTGAIKTSVGGVTISRAKAHKAHKAHKARKRRKRARRHKVRRRHVKVVTVGEPSFTG